MVLQGILLIVLGVLAAPSLLLSRKPNAKELLKKITPYQGWLGLGFCAWGIWNVIRAILNMDLMSIVPVLWITWIASAAIGAILGFILGYGMINQLLLSKNEEAKKKAERLLVKLAPIQGKLGLVGILVGVWVIVANLFIYRL